jgi:hypothetical protein
VEQQEQSGQSASCRRHEHPTLPCSWRPAVRGRSARKELARGPDVKPSYTLDRCPCRSGGGSVDAEW